MNALEIKDLTKHFPDFTLDHLNLTLPGGCIMGLIGENGAGKSTTIKLILDILHKDSGTITVLGRDHMEDVKLMKEEVGVVLDEVGLPDCITVEQTGKIMSRIFQNWDAAEYDRIVKKFHLPEKKQFRDFSRGTKMKLGIAVAMSHKSRLLLLDEPTGGLDPLVRDEVVEMFYEFTRDEDHSILISSHIVSDLEKLCDYIAFLHNGKLLLCEEKDRLLESYGILHCSREEFALLAPECVRYLKETPYGIEAIVVRRAVPEKIHVSPVSIEELFLFMAKEAR